MRTPLRLLVPLVVLVGFTTSADAAPMFTPLAKVRAEAKHVVVGTVSSSKAGLFIDVEYNLRGTAAKGKRKVLESPDGNVFVPIGARANNRVIAFIDGRNRFRWIGRLIAGPSLEKGVVRLAGFFNFNAHHVGPSVMTLTQLQHYLVHGTLNQRYKATLTFPDGKGGMSRSTRTLVIDYAALTRKMTLHGARWPCLNHPRFRPPEWGKASLFFHCRKSQRRLTLSGPVKGRDSAGVILVDLAPERPFLNRKGFDTFIRNAKFTKVHSVVNVSIASGKRWRWVIGRGVYDQARKLHKSTGSSSSSIRRHGRTVGHSDSYRFGPITIALLGKNPFGSNSLVNVVRRVNAGVSCAIRVAGVRHTCVLRSAPSQWK